VVTLNTGGLSQMKLVRGDQQGPGHPEVEKMYNDFSILITYRGNYGAAAAHPFSARRQDLPLAPCKTGQRDCFTGIRPILKSSLSAACEKADPLSRFSFKAF
jgi:hypothetical protein